jgi:hypothetical protein
MLGRKDLVTDLNNKLVTLVVQPPAYVVCVRGGLFQSCVSRDHLARDKILPDVEVFERPLRLRSPQFAAWDIHFTEAIGFFANTHYFHIADGAH